jgi:drug/metabolite transporter (DMT)-like permease
MQKKAMLIQVILLGITMVLGTLLKTDAIESARTLHRTASIVTLVMALLSMIIVLSEKATGKICGLAIVAFVATLLASVGGNLTRTSRYEIGYQLMIIAFIVALASSVATLAIMGRHVKAIVEK